MSWACCSCKPGIRYSHNVQEGAESKWQCVAPNQASSSIPKIFQRNQKQGKFPTIFSHMASIACQYSRRIDLPALAGQEGSNLCCVFDQGALPIGAVQENLLAGIVDQLLDLGPVGDSHRLGERLHAGFLPLRTSPSVSRIVRSIMKKDAVPILFRDSTWNIR